MTVIRIAATHLSSIIYKVIVILSLILVIFVDFFMVLYTLYLISCPNV